MINIKNYKILVIGIFWLLSLNVAPAENNFFTEAKKKFDEKKLEESKFLFQRNIVFNPKDAKSYIYLAKIFNEQDNDIEKEKNLITALLLDPTNEDAMYMLINTELDKSNYSEVKELKDSFEKICKNLCEKINSIDESLKDIEPKNES
tara:strand:+ start:2036 stop:2479 length:444 start_codon:yes stop_codon:yes gene_type:complete